MFFIKRKFERYWHSTTAKTLAGAKRAARRAQFSWHDAMFVGEGSDEYSVYVVATLTPDPIDASLARSAKWINSDPTFNRYCIYLACADNGYGGDRTRNGEPLPSFDEWLSR